MSGPSKKKLRRDTSILYVGNESDSLPSAKLPTNRQVLCFFMHLNRDVFTDRRQASRATIRAVMAIWNKTRVPCIQEIKAIIKVENLYNAWKKITKNASRLQGTCKNKTEANKVQDFSAMLDDLFDVSMTNAIEIMESREEQSKDDTARQMWREEIEFLLDQRKGGLRVFTIGGKDLKLKAKEIMAMKKKRNSGERLQKQKEDVVFNSAEAREIDEVLGNQSDSDESVSSDPGFGRSSSRGTRNIITPELVHALDTAKVGNGSACDIIAAASKAFGAKVEETNINRESLRRKRIQIRQDTATSVKTNLNADNVLTVHFDGKKVQKLDGVGPGQKADLERQAVVVTGITTNEVLGAPAIASGGAESVTAGVIKVLEEWGLSSKIKAASFDTTNVNSGCHSGAAMRLELYLGRELLWLPCRHHVMERMLEAAFREIMGPSSGPEDKVFKDFLAEWTNLDLSKFSTFSTLALSRRQLSNFADDIIKFAENQLEEYHPRADYRELLELTIIYLRGQPKRGVKFTHPGPMSSARWMAVAIYALKIVLFRKQLNLPKSKVDGFVQVASFVMVVYIEAWFTATQSVRAPFNDLRTLKKLFEYKKVHKRVAEATLTRFSQHLWYLSERFLGITVFDEKLEVLEREKIVIAMKNNEGEDEPPRKRLVQFSDVPDMTLSDLVTQNSMGFFKVLGIKSDFLSCPIEEWASREDYQEGKMVVTHLRVVNDTGERAVKLFKDFNKTVTKQEDSYQNLLVSVHSHRKAKPNNEKKTLIALYEK
ncbi:Glyceraldehyde-3-phosphate dehydrogenase, cytosolic [Frankliniella fusca]|uniref:Glyceraldehyde-3-phosphate dehydrogenase, cytosolic n=1 Tax=Frankliniella fusca TaxID=407009 RepID=A0AAE1LFU5_9NEOP|nr:Glyceraldehyde-3-phosphate dehydrogenase, cytosolic [Frankliniella fusca]KAK3918244.1 Glyceraldehyde-3-phosphate dehydrogenase, cytosolic [Frankliniella fusca]